MKKLFVYVMLLSSLVGLSQNPADKMLKFGKDSIDYNLLNTLIEMEINRERREHGLDTLKTRKDLREGAYRNSYKCYQMSGTQIQHTEKNVWEVAMYGTTGIRATLKEEASLIVFIWMKSPSHKEIILNPNLKYIGSGCTIQYKMIYENLDLISKPNEMGYVKRYFHWASVRFD